MNKNTYEKVKNFIEIESDSGCKLLSTEYNGDKYDLELECKCGNPFTVTYDRFRSNNQRQCKDCSWEIKKRQYKWNDYTKEDFIEIVKQRAIELDKIPRQEDFKDNDNLPFAKSIVRKLGVRTWNDVLKLCGVGKTKERNYNKDKALNNLKEYINLLGYVPTGREYKRANRQPSYNWFVDKFGSYENALKQIGYTNIVTNDDLLNILKNIYNKTGKSPTKNDLGNKNGLPSENMYYIRFNTQSWNEILQLAGLKLNHFQGYTKEYALDKLREYYNIYGKILTKEEFKQYNLNPAHDWYCKNFGTYENACFEAGLIDELLTDEERIEISINELKKLANELGRCPTVSQYESIKHRGFKRRNLEDKINLKYNAICNKYIPEFDSIFYLDKRGEICRSSVELYITNFLIDNNIKYEKETLYIELIDYMGRRRFDWKIFINDKVYYVEYFGLFNKNPKRKIDKQYLKNAKYKIRKLYKHGYFDKCLFIFPNDIKTKSLEEIFSNIGVKALSKIA